MSAKVLKAMREAYSMTRQRCYNTKCRDYKYYGGRGITICQRWLDSFDNFVADMGLRPEGMTLERVDNNGPYSKDNCVWATRLQQSANQRSNALVTYRGETLSVSAWAARLGIEARTLHARLYKLGYTPEEAFTKPVKCGGLLPGRVYKARRKPDMSRIPRGLDSPNTFFNRQEVLELREAYATGQETFSSLARRHSTSVTTVSNAVQGLGTYKDI